MKITCVCPGVGEEPAEAADFRPDLLAEVQCLLNRHSIGSVTLEMSGADPSEIAGVQYRFEPQPQPRLCRETL